MTEHKGHIHGGTPWVHGHVNPFLQMLDHLFEKDNPSYPGAVLEVPPVSPSYLRVDDRDNQHLHHYRPTMCVKFYQLGPIMTVQLDVTLAK